MEIQRFRDSYKKDWDEYIEKHAHATFYHQIGWKSVVEKTFGHKSYYLMAKQNGKIKGVLPLFLMRSKLFGNFLISLPFGGACAGVCADNKAIEDELVEEAKRIARDETVDYLELRHECNKKIGFITSKPYVNFILDLDPEHQKVWSQFKKDIKERTKKAFKSNLEYKMSKDYIKGFYRVWCLNMKSLGTPVYSYKFFANLLDTFSDKSNIVCIEYRGKVIAGASITFFKDTILGIFLGALKEYSEYCPTHLLYWETIKYGCKNGYRYFNMGRTLKDSGNFNFKQRWGAKPKELYYQYHLFKAKEIPFFHPSNPRYRFYIKIWKKLPLIATKIFGPMIIKNIP